MVSASSSTARRSMRLRDTATAAQLAQQTSVVLSQPRGKFAVMKEPDPKAAGSQTPVIATAKRKQTATDNSSSSPSKPKKRRLKAGSLKMVREMPYEILVEIFSYGLEPLDLYNLSRANTALHALLLSKSLAPPLWEAVRIQLVIIGVHSG